MAPITQLPPSPIRMILMGNSGSGKSGSLASLAAAGYNLRIIDCENSSHILYNLLTDPASDYVKGDPSIASRVSIAKRQDSYTNKAGTMVCSKATAWTEIAKLLTHWQDRGSNPDGSEWQEDLGRVSDWTFRDVLVIDSLTALGTCAQNHLFGLNGQLNRPPEGFEAQRAIGASQGMLENFFRLVTDPSLKCHVIVISHITFVTDHGVAPRAGKDNEQETSTAEGFPSALGRALSPRVPRFFNDMLVSKISGTGASARRTIHTVPQVINSHVVGAKSSAPNKTKTQYDIKDGLAKYFEDIFGPLKKGE